MAKKPEQERTERPQEFYTNAIQITVSPFEVKLSNQLVDQDGSLDAINVRMSLQTAWTLSKALQKNLAQYEEQHGEIGIPVELRKQYE